MTITQTVDITDDYRVTLEVPRNIPKGRTEVTIQFPVKEKPKANNDIPRFTEKEFAELMKDCPITQSLVGIIKSDMTLDEIRMERLKKYLL